MLSEKLLKLNIAFNSETPPRDWRALRRALFLVSLTIATLLGLNTAYLGWKENGTNWSRVERSVINFNNQVDASLSVLEYGTAAALAGAFLKRDEVEGVVLYDRYDFEVARKGISPDEAGNNSSLVVYRSSGNGEKSYSVVVLKKPLLTVWVQKVFLHTIITFFVSFGILRLLLGHIVERYFTTPLAKLADAMDTTRETGAHVEVNMPTDTLIGRLAAIFNEMQRESTRRSEELKRALQRAASANKAKSSFLANMSHELRSPLNAIIGFSQMLIHRDKLLGKDCEDKITEYAGSIENGGKHLLEIVNSVLDIKRIENGIFTISPVQLNIKQLKSEIIQLLDTDDCSNWLEIKHENKGGDGSIFADKTVIKQVLVNFICNAKFHNPKGTSVTVSMTTCEKETEIVVADNGVGMTHKDIQLALQPFARLSNPMVADSGGSGLGLPISRALILQHGGKFNIKSVVEKGTEIRFTLPNSGKFVDCMKERRIMKEKRNQAKYPVRAA